MKKTTLFILSVALATIMHAADVADYRVIPLPREISPATGADFVLDASTVITYPEGNADLKRNAEMLRSYIGDLTGFYPGVTTGKAAKNAIVLLADLRNDNPEAYRITVDSKHVVIDGASPAGNFYGVQTLRKSIPAAGDSESVRFAPVTINDLPRFGYRGAHLDVSRHFFPTDSVKTYIDMLALHNINRFHFHLTDDQGWRIEIKKHPGLTEVGSVRKGTMIGTDFNSSDSIPYGGYYTQDQLRDIVKYAADRYITVIPEIDMPGHMLGVLAAYPELGCTGGPYEVWQRWGISKDVLCAGNDDTYRLIEDVLAEVIDIFPSEFIHIGGDECPKDRWRECPKCQARIQQLGLVTDSVSTAEAKLQSHVMNFASDFLQSHGRRAIGWDEILEGGAKAPTAIMSWRGVKGARKAVKAGLDAILTPGQYCYFDYIQSRDTDEQRLSWAAHLPIDTVYSFDPIPKDLTPEEASHILGAQCNVWCEYIPTFHYAQYKALPRMAAISEVQWTMPEQKDFEDFYRRLFNMVDHYSANGYNYAKFVFRDHGDTK